MTLPAFATAKGVRMLLGNDFADTALRFELRHEPGGFYNESPANSQLAAVILERATGHAVRDDSSTSACGAPLGAGRAELYARSARRHAGRALLLARDRARHAARS